MCEFFYFCQILGFIYIFLQGNLFSASRQVHGYDPWIFILVLVYDLL